MVKSLGDVLPKCAREGCNNFVKTKRRKHCSGSCALTNYYSKNSSPQKGKTLSMESIEKMKETKRKNLKPRSLEVREKIRSTLKRKIKEGLIIPSQLGTKQSQETIRKRVESLKKTNNFTSKPEILFGNKIRDVFKVQLKQSYFLNGYCYDYKFGIFLFELDGSYWHSLPSSQARDIIKDSIAKENKYILIRFCLNYEKDVDKLIEDNCAALSIIFSDPYALVKDNEVYGTDYVYEGSQKVARLNCKYTVPNFDIKGVA